MAFALRATPLRSGYEVALGALALAASLVAVFLTRPASSPRPETIDALLLVVQPTDLPPGFTLQDGHLVSNAEAAAKRGAVPKNYEQLGRVNGYDATYTRNVSSGLSEVESSASIYRSSSGAHRSLELSYAAVGVGGADITRLPLSQSIGRDARLYLSTAESQGTKLDVYTLLWRERAVYATLAGIGRQGTVDPTQVLALANAQERRIKQLVG